jgi:hypothetical protein
LICPHSRTGTRRRLSSQKAFLGKGEDVLLARIERYLYALIAVVALSAVVVAVTPVTAQAKETAPTKDTKGTISNTAESVVVSPGDSLWSITSERLGPEATPQQIASGVERIYALNQDRIGGDPNLIFPGQRLLLPSANRWSRTEASGAGAPSSGATKPARVSRRDSGTEDASKVPGSSETKPVALPDMPPQQAAPKVGMPTTATDAPSPVEFFVRTARSLLSSATSAFMEPFAQDDRFGGRKLLGLVIIALTLLVTLLMAWKLPVRRNVGGSDVWGIPRGRVGGYMYPTGATDHHGGTSRLAPMSPVSEPASGSFGGEASTVENGPNGAAMIVAAQRRRHQVLREQEPGTRRSPYTGLATGAHDPRVRRHLRRARTSAPEPTLARRRRYRQRYLFPKGGSL